MKKFKEFLKERMSKVQKNQKGFSLVELIIVIAILGIIAAIALPNITSAVDNSRKTTDVTNAKTIANAVMQVRAKNDSLSGVTGTINLVNSENKSTDVSGAEKQIKDLYDAILPELNGKIQTPKFKGALKTVASPGTSTPITEEAFILSIDADGVVKIEVGKKTTVSESAQKTEIYPTPDASYDNK